MCRRPSFIAFLVIATITLACTAAPAIARLRAAPATAASVSAAAADITITFRSSNTLVKYGKAVIVAGYLTDGGEPLSGMSVTLRETRGGVTRNGGTATTDDQGFYRTSVAPKSSASWGATAAGASSAQIVIRVTPRVTLALSHTTSGTRLTEIFSGAVKPAHAGQRVLVQRAAGSGWRTVASGLLDRRSHYRVSWRLPYRTATYQLRVVLPAHADHAKGASPAANVRVRVRRG